MKLNIFKKLFCSVTLTIGALPIISLISCNNNEIKEKKEEDNDFKDYIIGTKLTEYKIQGEEEVRQVNSWDPQPYFIESEDVKVEIIKIGYNEYASGKVRALKIPKNAISLPKQIDPKINSIACLCFPNKIYNFSNLEFWDVSNITDMGYAFKNCYLFNPYISNWNVSKVTDMTSLFSGCRSFCRGLQNWNVSNVTEWANYDYGCELWSYYSKPIKFR